MSSHVITPHVIPESILGKIWDDVKPNFSVLFVVCVVVYFWVEISPIWLPFVAWLISFLAPAFWFLCEIIAVLAGILLFGFILAMFGLLLGGTIPKNSF